MNANQNDRWETMKSKRALVVQKFKNFYFFFIKEQCPWDKATIQSTGQQFNDNYTETLDNNNGKMLKVFLTPGIPYNWFGSPLNCFRQSSCRFIRLYTQFMRVVVFCCVYINIYISLSLTFVSFLHYKNTQKVQNKGRKCGQVSKWASEYKRKRE